MQTVTQSQDALDAAEYNMDVAYYDRCRGYISESEYKRACVIFEDAQTDLEAAEAHASMAPYTAVLPDDPSAHPMSGTVGEY